MRRRILLCGVALGVALCADTEASACMVLATGQTDRQIASDLRRAARDRLRRRQVEVEAALAAGVDTAAELATMLVPNVRPVRINETDCGPLDELDSAAGEETVEDLLAGTYLARYSRQFAYVLRDYEGETFGPACNAEFRLRFAAYLRRRLDSRQLRAAYLFLGSRWRGNGRPISRIVRFEDWQGRRPPVDWSSSYRRDIDRWVQRTDEGRAVQQLIDDFWRESAPLLEDTALACPAAAARWPEMQARIVAAIEASNPQFTAAIRGRSQAPAR